MVLSVSCVGILLSHVHLLCCAGLVLPLCVEDLFVLQVASASAAAISLCGSVLCFFVFVIYFPKELSSLTYELDVVFTENSPLELSKRRFKEFHDLHIVVVQVATTIREYKPYLPDTISFNTIPDCSNIVSPVSYANFGPSSIEALDSLGGPSLGYNFSNGQEKTCNWEQQKVSTTRALSMLKAEYTECGLEKSQIYHSKMVRCQGTLVLVKLDLMNLLDDIVRETYDLASSLVATTIDICKTSHGNALIIQADGLLMSWNTHSVSVQHPKEACRASLRMKRGFEIVEELGCFEWSVSIVSGQFYAGYIGSENRKSPFVLGPLVEQANVLSQLSHVISAHMLLTEEVYAVIGQEVSARPVDFISWNGSDELVYELLGADVTVDLEVWDSAFSSFMQGKNELALTMFDAVAADTQCSRLKAMILTSKLPTPYNRQFIGWQNWSMKKEGRIRSLPVELASCKVLGDVDHVHNLRHEIHVFKTQSEEGSSTSASSSASLPSHFTESLGLPLTFSTSLDVWTRGSTLGSGNFGSVWLAMSSNGSLAAMKLVKIKRTDTLEETNNPLRTSSVTPLRAIVNEVGILSKYKHDSVVQFIAAGVCEKCIVIIMEYVPGGSLESVIKQFGSISMVTVKRYTREILKGLMYLHSVDIIHRDLKPANVLLQIDGRCKLADFGASLLMQTDVFSEPQGTPLFMAPEAAMKAVPASDVWSLGLTVVQMVTSMVPFSWADNIPTNYPLTFLRWLCTVNDEPTTEIPSTPLSFPEGNAKDFVTSLIVVPHTRRPQIRELLHHPFIVEHNHSVGGKPIN